MGKKYREKEERNEFYAAISVSNTSSKNILLVHDLDFTWPSYETKKKGRGKNKTLVETKVDVRGQDVFAHSKEQSDQATLWDRFLLSKEYLNKNLISLTNDTNRLVDEYYAYLIDSYPASDRYHNLDINGHMWLRKVIRLAVTYHIMENKRIGHQKAENDESDDQEYFYDNFSLFYYTLMTHIKTERSEVASVMNHIIKDEDKKKVLLEEFFDMHTERLREVIKPILRIITNDTPQDDDDDDEKGIVAI